ncbi:MAG TPA: cation transporter, partial [Ramlibacter sp.]|nr:cation transporter [Ramlibacter sp.]
MPEGPIPPGYRRVLWIALFANAAMFVLEIAAGVSANSVSLLADAIDFFGDAVNYGLSVAVLAMGAVARARAAMFKAWTMVVFGVLVLARALWAAVEGNAPEPVTMGVVGALALATNVGVALLLYAYREGDANMRSVWLCTRNDAIGNVAV